MEKKYSQDALFALIDLIKVNPALVKYADQDALGSLFAECENDIHCRMVKDLLTSFTFWTSADLSNAAKKVCEQVANWGLNPKTTLLVAIADDDKPDGSQFVAKAVEASLGKFGLKYKVANRVGFAFQEKLPNGMPYENIVILDDFLGTGTKVIKCLDRLRKYVGSGPKFFVACLVGMGFGVEAVEAQADVPVFCVCVLKKGISESFEEPTRSAYVNAMLEMEQRIVPPMQYPRDEREKCCSFGYGMSESLFFLEGFSVPNNVFPLFWMNRYCDIAAYMPNKPKRVKKKHWHARNPILTRS